jgi:hypothetical protein
MNEILKRDRRSFLRDSALATGGMVGIAAGSPALAFVPQTGPADRRLPSGRSLSRQFAEWVAALRYQDLPPAVVDRAKGLCLQNSASGCSGRVAGLPTGGEVRQR